MGLPSLLQQLAKFLGGQRPEPMHEADPRVELWKAREALICAGAVSNGRPYRDQ